MYTYILYVYIYIYIFIFIYISIYLIPVYIFTQIFFHFLFFFCVEGSLCDRVQETRKILCLILSLILRFFFYFLFFIFFFLFFIFRLYSQMIQAIRLTLDVITQLHAAMIIYKTTIKSLFIISLRYTYQRMHEHRPSSSKYTSTVVFLLDSFFLLSFNQVRNIFHSSFHSSTVSLSLATLFFLSR